MNIKPILLAGAFLLAAQSTGVASTVPKINGTYLFSINSFCSLAVSPWPSGVTTEFDGYYQSQIGTAVFNSGIGQATVTGYQTSTQVIVPNSTGGSTQQTTINVGGVAYSNTATTFTILGNTGNIVYGKIVTGVAQQFAFSTITTSGNGVTAPNCVNSGTMTLIKPATVT